MGKDKTTTDELSDWEEQECHRPRDSGKLEGGLHCGAGSSDFYLGEFIHYSASRVWEGIFGKRKMQLGQE